jgi:hypothetical protein
VTEHRHVLERMRRWFARFRARRAAALVAALVMVLATTFSVNAQTRRVAVVSDDRGLVEAVALALAPWGLDVVGVLPAQRAPMLRDVLGQGKPLSAKHQAAIVVGIASDDGRAVLWIYEDASGQVTIRPLAGPPPYDEATAASVALSVKTLLRSTNVAPIEVREPPSAASSAPSASTPSTPMAPPSASTAQPATPPSTPSATPPVASPPSSSPEPRRASAPTERHALRLELLLGARFSTGADDPVEPRFGAGASFWPRAMREHVGFGVNAATGIGVAVARPELSGRYFDHVLGASARGRLAFAAWLAGEASLGGSLHLVSLSGERVAPSGHVSVQRVDPSIDGGLVLDFVLGPRFAIGAKLDATLLLRSQRFVVGRATALDPPALGLSAGARFSIALD